MKKMSAQVSVIKLISDIELSGSLQVDYAVTINLNGHVLKMGDIADGSVIKVNDGGHLTLIDSAPDAEHKFTTTPTACGCWMKPAGQRPSMAASSTAVTQKEAEVCILNRVVSSP